MDTGFTTPYQGYNLAALLAVPNPPAKMIAEIARRQAVRAGDRSLMTNGQNLSALNAKRK